MSSQPAPTNPFASPSSSPTPSIPTRSAGLPFRGGRGRGLPPRRLTTRGTTSVASQGGGPPRRGQSSNRPGFLADRPASAASNFSDQPSPSASPSASPSPNPSRRPRSLLPSSSASDSEYDELADDLERLSIDLDEVDDDLTAFQQDELVKQALTAGVDLTRYSAAIDTQLQAAEQASIDDYVTQSTALTALHTQLATCDGVLVGMSGMLGKFQGELGAISAEIESLQRKSRAMSVQLSNRKEAEARLYQFVHHVHLPEPLVQTLLDGDVNEHFMQCLYSLHSRIQYVTRQLANTSATNPSPRHSQAVIDVIPTLLRLKLKSVARVRLFLLERFHALQKPKTNIQIKQKLLIKYRYLYEFLLHHTDPHTLHAHSTLSSPSVPVLDVDVAAEIRQQYQLTLSHIYTHKFRTYLASLSTLLQPSTVDKTDLLGSEEGWKGGAVGGLFASKKSAAEITRGFMLNGRDAVLADSADDLIIPHIAEREGKRYAFERLYKSSQQLLMDTATSEYDFIVDFFGERMQREGDRAGVTEDEWMREREREKGGGGVGGVISGQSVGEEERGREGLSATSRDKHLFLSVFQSTITLFIQFLEAHLAANSDVLGVLLLIRVLCQHNLQMQYRRVHCIDAAFDRMNMTLWPHFKQLFDAHVRSVSELTHIDLPPLKATATPSTLSAQAYQRPLYVVTRYAHLTSALWRLNQPYHDDILLSNMRRLHNEVNSLLKRTVSRVSLPKMQRVFLINQYQHILAQLRKAGMSKAADEEVSSWEAACSEQVSQFAEEELSEKFGQLVAFVQETEKSLAHEHKQSPTAPAQVDLTALEPVVKHFAKYWRVGVESVNSSVRVLFSDEGDGAVEVLRVCYVQLLLYYKRMTRLVHEWARNRPQVMKDIIPTNTLSHEMRKYTERQDT